MASKGHEIITQNIDQRLISHTIQFNDVVWLAGHGASDELDGPYPIDPSLQLRDTIANIRKSLNRCNCDLKDMTKLLCFVSSNAWSDEECFLIELARLLPAGTDPAITVVEVPYHPYPGMLVQIEGYAMTPNLERTKVRLPQPSPLPSGFSEGVRCGKMIFVSGQTAWEKGRLVHSGSIIDQTKALMKQVSATLSQFGADFDDVVKVNRWYLGKGTTEDFEPASLACASHFSEPGPAATGIPLPRFSRDGQMIKIEVVAMLAEDGTRLPRQHSWPESLWDWTIKLPYRHGIKCHDMIYMGGQVSLDKKGHAVDPDKMQPQARQAMAHIGSILRDLGADYRDLRKITAMYEGKGSIAELNQNLSVRSEFFHGPQPPTTNVVFPKLCYPGMIIEIDGFAMVKPH